MQELCTQVDSISAVVPDYGLRQLAASSCPECKRLLHNGAVLTLGPAVWNSLPATLPDSKKVKVAHTRLPSVGFRSWSRFLAVSLQVIVSHKPGGRLPLLFARPAVTHATLKRAATNFAAWWTEAQCVWTVCLRLLPDSVATAIWTRAILCLSPAR